MAKHAQALKQHEARVQAQLALMGQPAKSVNPGYQTSTSDYGSHGQSHASSPVIPQQNHPAISAPTDDYGFVGQSSNIFSERNKIVEQPQQQHHIASSFSAQEHPAHYSEHNLAQPIQPAPVTHAGNN